MTPRRTTHMFCSVPCDHYVPPSWTGPQSDWNHNANGIVSDCLPIKWAEHIFAWAKSLILCKKWKVKKKHENSMDLLKGKNGWIRLKQWFLPPITGVSSVNRKFSPPILGHIPIFEELLVVFRPNLRAAPSSHFLYHPASKVTQGHTRRAATRPQPSASERWVYPRWECDGQCGLKFGRRFTFRKFQGDSLKSETNKSYWCSMGSRFSKAILGYPWESPGESKTRSGKKEPDSIWHRNGQSTGWRSELIHSHVFDVWYLGCVWNWMICPQFVAILLEKMRF